MLQTKSLIRLWCYGVHESMNPALLVFSKSSIWLHVCRQERNVSNNVPNDLWYTYITNININIKIIDLWTSGSFIHAIIQRRDSEHHAVLVTNNANLIFSSYNTKTSTLPYEIPNNGDLKDFEGTFGGFHCSSSNLPFDVQLLSFVSLGRQKYHTLQVKWCRVRAWFTTWHIL